jgi:hypothetical protein
MLKKSGFSFEDVRESMRTKEGLSCGEAPGNMKREGGRV